MGCAPNRQLKYSHEVEENHVISKTKENTYIISKQSSMLPGSKNYINPNIADYDLELENYKNKTVIGEILQTFQNFPNCEGLGYRKPLNEKECEKKFTFFKYSQIKEFSETVSKNLILENLCPLNHFDDDSTYRFLGIFARNCFEWAICDLACQLNQITSVTFYATLGDVAFNFIAEQTKLTTVCVSPENVSQLTSYIKKYNIKSIINVILFDFTLWTNEEHLKSLEALGLKVIPFSKLLEKNNLMETIILNVSHPETILTLCYTSGTTGIPKGAKISQNNLVSSCLSVFKSADVKYSPSENVLIYLPLAHIMERLNITASLIYGVKTGFLSGDVRTSLSEDMEILKPTIVLAVPRVLQLFRTKILDGLEKLPEGCKKNTAMKAIRVKRENYREDNKNISHFLYDKTVFSKIREKFGGKIRAFVTGSAPLTDEVAIDIKIIFGCTLIEGYGLTETCAGCTISSINEYSNNSSGGPLLNIKLKLVDVPEMKYDSKTVLNGEPSPTGEVCIFGPNIFKGYFQNKKATDEAIDEEGWFHTGDIGRILPGDQGLKIIDRKKEIFKLAQGEYIAPSKLESVYSKSRFVTNVCVYGNSYKNYLVAVLVPNKETVLEFLRRKGKSKATDLKEIENIEDNFNDPEFVQEVKEDFEKLAKQGNLNSLERIKGFILSKREFTIQNGCLTATLKLARNVIVKEFEKEIEESYSKLAELDKK